MIADPVFTTNHHMRNVYGILLIAKEIAFKNENGAGVIARSSEWKHFVNRDYIFDFSKYFISRLYLLNNTVGPEHHNYSDVQEALGEACQRFFKSTPGELPTLSESDLNWLLSSKSRFLQGMGRECSMFVEVYLRKNIAGNYLLLSQHKNKFGNKFNDFKFNSVPGIRLHTFNRGENALPELKYSIDGSAYEKYYSDGKKHYNKWIELES